MSTKQIWPAAFLGAALAGGCSPSNSVTLGPRNSSTAQLRQVESCTELQTSLQSALSEQMRATILSSGFYAMRGGDMMAGAPEAAADSAGGGAPRQEGVDFSTTNNQEAGVDEADFVKISRDGYFIYVLNGHRLEVLGVPEYGSLTKESSLELEGSPAQMLTSDSQVVVFSTIYTATLPEGHPLRRMVGEPLAGDVYGWWYWSSVVTKLTVIDVSQPTSPAVTQELYLEGWYQTGRRVEDSVRMVSHAEMEIPGLQYWVDPGAGYWNLDWNDPQRQALWAQAAAGVVAFNDQLIAQTSLQELVPRIFERLGSDVFVEHRFTEDDCRSFAMADDALSRGITSIISIDLAAPGLAFDHDHIVTNWSTVYASTDMLVIAEAAWDWWWYYGGDDFQEKTNLHTFDISVPGETSYTGSGRIDGSIVDQFSLSEHEGLLRVAATTGTFWPWWGVDGVAPQPESHILTLQQNGGAELTELGRLDGIAPGERLWSSRFDGDRAFLVTFENIDPLWTIDLSVPAAPRIAGELEVPGVSTYLHPIDGNLLSIGYGGDDSGMNWWQTQVALFNVGDFSSPSLTDTFTLAPPPPDDGWSYAWSEATYEHKAFLYWAPRQLLAIPVSTYRSVYDAASPYGYEYEYYTKLQLVTVDPVGGLSAYGEIDHSGFYNSDADFWWSLRDVRRTIVIGDYVYAISDRGVTAHNLDTMALSASVTLQGTDPNDWYWWW